MIIIILFVILGIAATTPVGAHYDTMMSVVKAIQKALDTENVDLVFMWIKEKDKSQIEEAFNKTITFRKLSQKLRSLQTS